MAEPTEVLEEIPLDEDDPGKSTIIGADLDGINFVQCIHPWLVLGE